jgi:hypothetical protein
MGTPLHILFEPPHIFSRKLRVVSELDHIALPDLREIVGGRPARECSASDRRSFDYDCTCEPNFPVFARPAPASSMGDKSLSLPRCLLAPLQFFPRGVAAL